MSWRHLLREEDGTQATRLQTLHSKEIILGILTTAVGLLNAYLWQRAIATGGFSSIAPYSLPVAAFFAFAILFALSSAFIQSRWLRDATAVVSVVAGFLFVPYSALVFSVAALAAATTWYAAATIAGDRKRSLHFQVRNTLRGGLPVFFTAVAMLLAVFYLATLSAEPPVALVPRALFDVAVPFAAEWSPPDRSLVSEYAAAGRTLEDIATASLAGIGIDVSRLSPLLRQEYLREALEQLSKNFGVTVSGSVSGEEKVGDILYQSVNVKIDEFLGPYRRYIPYLSALGFLIAVKTSTYPVYWVTLLLVFAVVKLLVAIGVLQRKSETVQREQLSL